MDVTLITSSRNDIVHGATNPKSTGCGIKLQKSENATVYRRGRLMKEIGEITCEKCKERIAKEMIKADQREMKILLKEEKQRAKRGIEDEGIVPLGNTTAKITGAQEVPKKEEPSKPTYQAPASVIDDDLAQFAIEKPDSDPFGYNEPEPEPETAAEPEPEPVQETPAPAAQEDDFLAQFAVQKPQDDFLAQFAIPAPGSEPEPEPEPAPAPVQPAVSSGDDILNMFSIGGSVPGAAQQQTAYNENEIIDVPAESIQEAEDETPLRPVDEEPELAGNSEWDKLANQLFGFGNAESEPAAEEPQAEPEQPEPLEMDDLAIPAQTAAPVLDDITPPVLDDIAPAAERPAAGAVKPPVLDDIVPAAEKPAAGAVKPPVLDDIVPPEIEDISVPARPVIEDISVPELDDIAPAYEPVQEAPEPEYAEEPEYEEPEDTEEYTEEYEDEPEYAEEPQEEPAFTAPEPVRPAAVQQPVQQTAQPAQPVQPVQQTPQPVQQPVQQTAAAQKAAQTAAAEAAALAAAQQLAAPQQPVQPVYAQPAAVPYTAPVAPVAPAAMPQPQSPVVTVPQFTGYDANNQPVYSYVQMQLTGYDPNGQPIYVPLAGQPVPMPAAAPAAPAFSPMQSTIGAATMGSGQNASLIDRILNEPTDPHNLTVGQKIAAANANVQDKQHVSKIATNDHARSTSQAFINAISDAKSYANESLTDTQGLKQRTKVIGSVEDVLSALGDNSMKQKKAAEAKQATPTFSEFKGPSKQVSTASSAAPKPPREKVDDRPLTKKELKEKKKQEKIDAKFKKDMAKRGF
ncbi:MAG: hypothetical protein IJ737_01585 [Ruminococcus sp.]|nr:hypothetical protein [Ruminococcus sp.]MBR2282993.1 hypothetical protein [Ruminococcus sp.]